MEWQNADVAFKTIENPITTGMTNGMPYGIAPGNHASLAVARRALFAEEGRLRRAGVTHDGPIDLIVLSRLSDDPRPEVAVGGTSAPTSVKHP